MKTITSICHILQIKSISLKSHPITNTFQRWLNTFRSQKIMDEEISKRLGETPTGEHLQLPLNIDKVQEIWQTDKSFSKREMNSLVAEISHKSLLQWVGHLGQLGKCTWVSRSSLLSVSSCIKLAVASTNKHCFLHSMIFASFFFPKESEPLPKSGFIRDPGALHQNLCGEGNGRKGRLPLSLKNKECRFSGTTSNIQIGASGCPAQASVV